MADDVTTPARIHELEDALAFFREQLAHTDPSRGYDSARRHRALIGAITRTRADLIIARLDWESA